VSTKLPESFVDLPPPIVRAAPVADAPERLRLGAEELRAGRVDAAEAQFFRAGASGLPFLVVSCLARGDWEDAWAHVVRAAGADRFWFRKADPRVLLGPETLARVIAALEGRVRDNPLDARAKTLLAYLLYHEKSPSHATGLLVAATGVDPGNAEARQFLENHDR
jgi:cytochrome c-type biogenesis protein CcmH/NrfG